MATESQHDREIRRARAMETGSPIPPRHDSSFEANLARTSAEAHQAMATKLWAAADTLGTAIGDVEMMGDRMWDAIAAEADAADKVVIEGRDVMKALRTLAMRLDRAVMVRMGADD